ncbi:ribosomal protein S6 kinase delta-1 isoform X2 [Latimeria chalumnae]|uniref:ribosomal protein S6 kinase delta-1 isoform X2 n=1 Tax=Latimeria chalumnae TaxID=7897 RepID=UPI00313DCD20
MISHRDRGDLARFYTVTDPKKHRKGYTVYKVTARIISRRNPEDVQEIVVWKRYSDFKKLHKDLWQIHKNLYRQSELFPPFAKAKVFGRFDEPVIEERRQCAEDLLQFSANIPALYNSKQLEEFFRDGEVHDGSELIGPAESLSESATDSISNCSSEVRKDLNGLDDVTLTSQSEYGVFTEEEDGQLPKSGTRIPGFSSDSDLISLTVDVDSVVELDDEMTSSRDFHSTHLSLDPSLGASAVASVSPDHEAGKSSTDAGSRGLFSASIKAKLGKQDYLEKAGELIKLALQKEAEQDYEGAFSFYSSGVDLLLEGVQGEPSPTRREAVKKKTAEYLMRAEQISTQHLKNSSANGSLHSVPPGLLSSRPSWNLRSPAVELKAFRVLGVIDKILLAMDTRTQETFILKGLRKSSECSRNRKTIIPRCVPNMVRLHNYIISEESIFLVLQYAEGGKLWSYVSRFLNRNSEENFEAPEIEGARAEATYVEEMNFSGKDISSSVESRESNSEKMLSVLPLKASLTPSSQDDSSTQDEDGQDSLHRIVDSETTSEEECATSYLTLCNEYEQEKIEPDSLSEEPLLKLAGEAVSTREAGSSFQLQTVVSDDSLTSPFISQELRFFTEDSNLEVFSPTRASDSLNKSKKTPMEFFRIDSKDSTSELLGLDLGEKLSNLKADSLNPPHLVLEFDSSSDVTDIKGGKVRSLVTDTISKESSDSVPVISFQDAIIGETSGCEEGRPDLLVNLPGVSEQVEADELNLLEQIFKNDSDLTDSKSFETPDVLLLNHNLDQIKTPQGVLNQDPLGFHSCCGTSSTDTPIEQFYAPEEEIELFPSVNIREAVRPKKDHAIVLDMNCAENVGISSARDPYPQELRGSPSVPMLNTSLKGENSLITVNESSLADQSLGNQCSLNVNIVGNSSDEVLLFTNQNEHFIEEQEAIDMLPAHKDEDSRGDGERRQSRDKEISQIFKDLDEQLLFASQVHIPESYIQIWAAEMIVALDSLHQEGIVCRDLNPNNILLNDRGHIQLTYFSRWSEVEDSCDSDAIERMYCAPEIGSIAEETEACDWWSLGAVLFELLTGTSLYQCHPAGINTHTSLNMPDYVSEEARSLIQQIGPSYQAEVCYCHGNRTSLQGRGTCATVTQPSWQV